MTNWEILLLVCGAISIISFLICLFMMVFIEENRKDFKPKDLWMLLVALFIIPFAALYALIKIFEFVGYLSDIRKAGGFKNYRKIEEDKKREHEAYLAEQKKAEEERERIKNAYLKGDLAKTDLPRQGDGIETFEFDEEMNLSVDYDAEVREIVYVENEYNQLLNDYFIRNKDLRLYHMYKFVYLPNLSKEINEGDIIRYISPDLPLNTSLDIKIDSSYPLKYLWHPDDAKNIIHGMMFFMGDCDNHGAKYTKGHYFHLNEGSDEEIIAQLDKIVKEVHSHYGHAALYSKIDKPEIEEGSNDEYADELFRWINNDPEVAIIVKEVRDKVNALRERGMAEKLIRNLIKIDPKLSRLVVTKDMRILLPDYNDMEITMEPINKAVFLLFLRHPEGIIFKHLPDYRKELAEIYQKIKPFGLNDRVIRSIEDVTNPCLNSINEKCARIRGAFISQFDEELAKHYYINGWRGEAKKISLPRELVTWE